MAKAEHLSSVQELDLIFDAKRVEDYWGRKQPLKVEEQEQYAKRKKALECRSENKTPELEAERSTLEKELLLTQNKQLHKIITRENINSIFSITSTSESGRETSFIEIKDSEYFDLLKYLIRNGYIDETYADYMTYFYENSLSRIDKTFLRSITDKKAKEYTYKLKNPKLVVSRLRSVDFDQEEILNFDLLIYLLQSLSPVKYLDRYINQLKETKNFKFIGAFFDTTSELPAYVMNLNSRWPEMFMTALETDSLSDKQIRQYSIDTIYYSDDDIIQIINKDDCK